MSTLTYPSPDFPAPPQVNLVVTDPWQPFIGVGVPLAVHLPVEPGRFRPNIVVTVTLLAPGRGLEEAFADAARTLSQSPDYSELGREQLVVSGFPAARIEAAFTMEGVGTLLQAARLVLVEDGPASYLVEITGTCDGEQAQNLWGAIREIQSNAVITRWSDR